MPLFETMTADQVIIALLATVALREAMLLLLPDSIAGPRGWLVRTGSER
ncbi:hypothetical protein [Sinisalibacter lacisalsi]|uniref:Uncharacterized protein n=1 Tax=Sinisalibacter lacisalsi TaxID=1526570 RepID=A0ABQ1QUU3_9RHOB|nr:hypothetical protein [Sinisalibacter lacisalsi]GGD47312.1 hypothetical protein GCM10011358_33920 [Sinisalibacter lacisalsi]